jgi:hypothetical protein
VTLTVAAFEHLKTAEFIRILSNQTELHQMTKRMFQIRAIQVFVVVAQVITGILVQILYTEY